MINSQRSINQESKKLVMLLKSAITSWLDFALSEVTWGEKFVKRGNKELPSTENSWYFKYIFQPFSCRCCGSWKKQDTLQVLQCSHPAAYSRAPAFLRIDKAVLEALKKARNNSLVNRMGDEYGKTEWESLWHCASQQLHALEKMLACPSPE